MSYGVLKGYALSGQTVNLRFEGGEARLELTAPGIVNVFAPLASQDHRSKAIEGDKTRPVPFTAERREDGLWVEAGEVKIRVGDGFCVDFFDAGGNEVCMDYRGGAPPAGADQPRAGQAAHRGGPRGRAGGRRPRL